MWRHSATGWLITENKGEVTRKSPSSWLRQRQTAADEASKTVKALSRSTCSRSDRLVRSVWRMWETEQFWGTIDFHCIFFFLLWRSMVPKTAWLQTFFKISSFVFSRTKTFIQVWNYLRVSKWWQDFHFWVNYPFKSQICFLLVYIVLFTSLRPFCVKTVRKRKLMLKKCNVKAVN